jgi:PhnB protein
MPKSVQTVPSKPSKSKAARSKTTLSKTTQSKRVQHLSAYLSVRGALAAIDFYTNAFGAKLAFKLLDPSDGRVGHSELRFGSSIIYLSDEYPDFGAISPDTLGGTTVKMQIEVDDAEAFVLQACSQGATVLRPLKLEFYGYQSALLADPFGYSWFVQSKVEEVSPAEMQKRWNAMMGG